MKAPGESQETRTLRWVLLGMYLLVLASLVHPLWAALSLRPWWPPDLGTWGRTVLFLAVLVACQVILLKGAGTRDLCQPIRGRRLLVPVLTAAMMMGILLGALFLSLRELFLGGFEPPGIVFWLVVGVGWLLWGVVFWFYTRRVSRYRVLKRLTTAVLAGSLLELLAAIPAHIIVTRKPGCCVGVYTMLGIIAGVCVMLWAFGPGIILLFLRERYRTELRRESQGRVS